MRNFTGCVGRAAVLSCLLLAAAPAPAKVHISGVGDDIRAVLLAVVSINDLPCDAPRWWVDRRHRQAPDEIRRGLELYGFYNALVESAEITWDESCWQATYALRVGERTRIERFDLAIEGDLAEQPRLRSTVEGLRLGENRIFTHHIYEGTKDELLDVAQALGYFDARFTRHTVTVDPERNRAVIELALDGGERYRIGRVEVDQSVLRDGLFQRYLRFAPGDPYDADRLTLTYRDLLESDYFDRVFVAPEFDLRENGAVPVMVTASASTRRTALVGAGYATDTGPRARLDLRYRRVNDAGHRAELRSMISAVAGELRAEYRLPYGDPTHEWLFVRGNLTYEDTGTFEDRQRGVTVGRTLRRFRTWAETNYIEYTVSDFEIGEQQEGRSQLLLLGSSWTRSTSVDTPRPLRGYSLGLDVRGASKALLSDNDLVQATLRARQIVSLGERVRLIGRAQAGWTWQNEFEELPPKVRYFAGGDNSVRGYGYQQLGPEEDGDVVGGKRLLTGSLELDFLVRPSWSVALFADTGSAFNNSPDFSTGVGLGVRWFSPLGPLRVDLAHPLDDPDRNVRLHISLGPDL